MSAIWRRVTEGAWASSLLNRIGAPKGRREQEALDVRKLFLNTLLFGARQHPVPHGQLLMQVEAVPYREQREAVRKHVGGQLLHMAKVLHEALHKAGDAASAAHGMEAGLARLQAEEEMDKASPSSVGAYANNRGTALSQQQLSEIARQQLGYSLRVGRSTVQHPAAGRGLFLTGEAAPGSVLAILPGVVYQRTQLNKMPNYPKVDLDNDYLSSTYDLTIVDSKPWGTGQAGASPSQAPSSPSASRGHHPSGSQQQYQQPWPLLTSPAAGYLGALEGRHPYALGHLVNHPAPGMHPNVLEFAFSLQLDPSVHPPWVRAYLPLAPMLDPGLDPAMALLASAGYGPRGWRAPVLPQTVSAAQGRVTGIVLVATRAIKHGEELLQNYRLNPGGPRPEWYVPYDAEEEARRWAKPAYASLLK